MVRPGSDGAVDVTRQGQAESGATRTLTALEAQRAIYIDFEGRVDEPPAVLGILYAEGRTASPDHLVLRHEVLDPILRPLGEAVALTGFYRYDVATRSMPQALADVLRRAKSQRRPVVSWSQHEGRMVGSAPTSSWAAKHFGRWYVDGKATAKRWKSITHPEVEFTFDTRGGANKLSRYAELVGYQLPPTYGSGQVGSWIGTTREAVTRRGEWDQLTDTQQRKWMLLLEHNAHDLLALREVVLRAATELQSAHRANGDA